MNSRRFAGILVTVAAFSFGLHAQADVLWSISTTEGNVDDGYDPSTVTANSATNVTGPTNTTFDDGANNLTIFRNSSYDGFSLASDNGDFVNSTEFASGYLSFTIAADPGFSLDLTSLTFDSARGGSQGERGVEIYAAVNGAAFVKDDDQVFDLQNETGTRTDPVARSVDLSATKFDDIQSITFRYYPATDAVARSIDFNNLVLNGTVIPEPASLALLGLGSLCLLPRRRSR